MPHTPASEGASGWRATLRSRWTLLSVGCVAYWTATQALRPMVALRLDDLGAGDALIGVIIGLFALVTFALALPSGRLMDQIGLRRALRAGLVGMVLAGLAFTGTGRVWQVAVVLMAAGVAELASWLSLQALASHAGTGQGLRQQLALFSFAWGFGAAVGPSIGSALYARGGFAAVALLYSGAGAAALAASLGVPSPAGVALGSGPPAGMGTAVRTMWASPPVRAVLLSSFVALFVYGIRNSFYPLLLERQGVPLPQIGLLLSVIGLSSLLIRVPLPALLKRTGPERALVLSMWLAIIGMSVTPWLHSVWLLGAAAAIAGAGLGVNAPVTVELMAIHTSAGERGLAMGLRVGANRLAQMVQPVLFGAVAATVGMPLAFAAGGVVMSLIAAAVRPPPR